VALAGVLTVAALGLFLVFRWLARSHAPDTAA
jgi:hypothetical protein